MPIPSGASTWKVWFGKPETYPVIAVIIGGCAFSTWFTLRTARTHNDLTFNKKNPYQFRVEGNTPKLVHTRSDTHKNLKYNEKTMRWE